MRVGLSIKKQGPTGGVIAAASITVGSAQWYKSSGGGAWAAVGAAVTPVYDTTTGILYAEKQIANADWANDDEGRWEMTGVEVKLDEVTAKMPTVTDVFTVQDLSALTASMAGATWDEARSAHVASGSFGEALNLYTTTSGTFVLANNTTEQSIAIHNQAGVFQIHLDLQAITQNGTIRVYKKTNGGTRAKAKEYSYVVNTSLPEFYSDIFLLKTNDALEATYQAGSAEGATRNIPYVYPGEPR